MTAYVLVIEDDDDFLDELREILNNLPTQIEIQTAQSRDEAIEVISKSFFDLIILDLKIPPETNALDADPKHGNAVFDEIRIAAPGSPIFVLTASPAEPFLREYVTLNQERVDIWGEGTRAGFIRFLKKSELEKSQEMLSNIANAVDELSDVELNVNSAELTLAQDRLIRIFAKKCKGKKCEVFEIGSGLSGARVVRLHVTDHQGVTIHDAVAKLASHKMVQIEVDSYNERIARLAPSATPRMLRHLEYGAHSLAGVFYGLAEGSDSSLFDCVDDSQVKVAKVIYSAKQATVRWTKNVPETSTTVGSARLRLLDNDEFNELRAKFDLGWTNEFETRSMQARITTCHGDLHGNNILVSPSGAQIIDYSDVGPGPASLDPITLELSLLFHPNSRLKGCAWPSMDQAKMWGDLDKYLIDCPAAFFVQECRSWAMDVGAGQREVAAAAYSYLMRQLKYEDTNKPLALALLDGVHAFFDENT